MVDEQQHNLKSPDEKIKASLWVSFLAISNTCGPLTLLWRIASHFLRLSVVDAESILAKRSSGKSILIQKQMQPTLGAGSSDADWKSSPLCTD